MVSNNYSLEVDLSTIPSWELFAEQADPYSIALDGKVKAPTQEDISVSIANYNHHDGVDRYSTKATCEQVFEALKMGLSRAFPKIKAMVNDCDQDVITSNALLRSQYLVDIPSISRLVSVEGRLDTYGGGYNYDPNKIPFLEQVSWIFEPYTQFRQEGGLQRGNPDEYLRVIEDASTRIEKYGNGQAGNLPVDDRYENKGRIGNFTEIERIGAMASLALARDGVGASAEIKPLESGLIQVTLAKIDRFQQCTDLVHLAGILNDMEREAGGSPDWGGGNAYCCSPRNIGTVLTRDAIETVLKNTTK